MERARVRAEILAAGDAIRNGCDRGGLSARRAAILRLRGLLAKMMAVDDRRVEVWASAESVKPHALPMIVSHAPAPRTDSGSRQALTAL